MTDGMSTGASRLLGRVQDATKGEYTIMDHLGRGGMATVYLARDLALDRLVAIKVLLPDLVEVEGLQDRFVIEARTAARLDHPNIITVYSVKELDGLLFIVMKYVEGRTLEQVLKENARLDRSVVATIVSRVAEALHFAHVEGIIHRDVKPSNIMVDTRGRAVVTDFGIAKVASGQSLTVTGSILGTPAYMSPEQCWGEPVTPASDQYSLGVLTYQLLAGRLPFEGTLFGLIRAHADQRPPSLLQLVPDLDPELGATVHRMLEKAPQDRWPSLEAVLSRLASHLPSHDRMVEARGLIAVLAGRDRGSGPVDLHGSTPPPGATDVRQEGDLPTRVADTPPPTLLVTPEEPTVAVGERVQLRVSESSRAPLGSARVEWRSEDPSVAEVDDKGVVTGRSDGAAKITATAGAAVGRAVVTVQAVEAATRVHSGDYSAVAAGAAAGGIPPGGAPPEAPRQQGSDAVSTHVFPAGSGRGNEAASWLIEAKRVAPVGIAVLIVFAAAAWFATRGDESIATAPPTGTSEPAAADPIDVASPLAATEEEEGSEPAPDQAGAVLQEGAGVGAGETAPRDSPAQSTPSPTEARLVEQTAPPPQTTAGADSTLAGQVADSLARAERAEEDRLAAERRAEEQRLADSIAEAGRIRDSIAAAERAALCVDGSLPTNLISSAFSSDPLAGFDSLYRPQDAADGREKSRILDELRDTHGLTASVRALDGEAAGSGCDWSMGIEFRWTNAFGQPRGPLAVQLRASLEMIDGSPRVVRLYGASGRD